MTHNVNDHFTAPMTRRRLLGSAAGMAIAAAANLMPPNLQRALADEKPGKGKLSDIKHVVMLMQENRSFDHYFGTLARRSGFWRFAGLPSLCPTENRSSISPIKSIRSGT